MMERCADCRFWEVGEESEHDVEGECHRHPPVLVQADGGYVSLWPTCAFDRWCGDFDPKVTG